MLFGAENGGHECLADVDTVLSLTEVVGVGGAVDVGGNLVDARQGMEDAHVGFASLEHGGGEDAAVFDAFVFEGIGEALTLHTGHVDDVGCGDDALDVGVLVVFESGVLDAHLDGRGEFELVGRDEVEGGVEVAHGLDEGMDGAAVFEVADAGDVEVLEGALSLADGIKVEHALGGVLVGTVAGVDYRHGGHFGSIARGAFLGVAHDDEVGIAGDHDDGVVERFTFLYAGAAGVAEPDDACTKLVGCTLEAEPCARGGLEEEGGNYFVAENALLGVLFESFGNIQHLDVFFFAEVGDGNEVASF